MVQASMRTSEHGLVPAGEGWFVLSAREARWLHAAGRSAVCQFQGDEPFAQVGVNLCVMEPGQPMAMYHWEADQEDFLVLSGQALLIIEGAERTLSPWDLVHCPPGTSHTIIGAGTGPCIVLAIGARDRSTGEDWGGYPVEPLALRLGAGVGQETKEPKQAYAGLPRRQSCRFDPHWLPEPGGGHTNS